jgi:uncharacterized membrane protein YdbT with pleckstrin-like domain
MVDQNLSQYAALLRQQYMFQGLDEAQLAHILTRFEPVDYKAGEEIFSQGEEGRHFFVIFKGSVHVSERARGKERSLGNLTPGGYFGETSLLFNQPRTATITAREPTTVLRLDREDFLDLLQKMPGIRMNLSATAESRYLLHKENFDWLGEDEVVYLVARKHPVFLYTSLILPILMGVVSIPVLTYSLAAPSQFWFLASLIGGIFLLVFGILWGIWNWLDWGNDFYIVTDQRVIWLERVIGIYSSRREAPLTQVLAVKIKRSFFGRHLDYGDVEVRTFTGAVRMQKMNQPKRFEDFVRGYQQRAQHIHRQAEAAMREQAVRAKLGMPALEKPKVPGGPRPPGSARYSETQAKPGTWRHRMETLLRVRYEQNGVITYRKHLLLLVRKVFFPTLVGLLILVGFTYLMLQGFNLALFLLEGLLLLGVFLWWLYQYVDWTNDIYQLTPDQVLDIEIKPLGKEDKKSAPLDSILSIEHVREGLIQLIFNYGTVVINVGQTEFDFRGVTNPDQVHQDVADYIEARRRKKQDEQANQERENLSSWLATYHEQREILEEVDNPDWDIFPR